VTMDIRCDIAAAPQSGAVPDYKYPVRRATQESGQTTDQSTALV
jgi:hypothetical protein